MRAEKNDRELRFDLAIKNCHILTLDENWTEYSRGLILIKDKLISFAGTDDGYPLYTADKVIDALGGLVMPTFFNGHTHSAMSVLRGYGSDNSLKDWLEKFIWPAEAKFITPDNTYLGSMISGIEMVRGGTSIFADMYFFQEDSIRACEELGIRMIVGEGILDFPTPNMKTPDKGLELTEELIRKYKNHPLLSMSIPAHAPYSCSPDVLQKIGVMAKTFDIPATIHLAETSWEIDEMKKRYGKSSTELLLELGFFDGKSVAYHCNHLSEYDLRILRDNKVGVVSNPKSNMKLGSGVCPVPALFEYGIEPGIGSDGAATNNNNDILGDLQLMARLHKLNNLDPEIITARQVIRMATRNNARIYGMGDELGSIEAGKLADLIIIDTDQAHWQPMYDPYASIVYAMQNGDILSTIINGKVLMENRNILTVDEEKFQEEIILLGKEISAS